MVCKKDIAKQVFVKNVEQRNKSIHADWNKEHIRKDCTFRVLAKAVVLVLGDVNSYENHNKPSWQYICGTVFTEAFAFVTNKPSGGYLTD